MKRFLLLGLALVDAQLTKTSAEKVLRQIKDTRKPLSLIYLTHEHADHFLGLEVFRDGDTVFNDMHVYTAETDSNARKNWSNTLKKIRELKPSVVIPGHGKVGAPLGATTALDFTERYLLVFEEELKKAKDPESLVKAIKDDFPSADLILAVERGAKANIKH